MEVDFENGSAVVEAADETGFDPLQIAGFISDAGFDAREVRIRVRGRLGEHRERPALLLPASPSLLVLAGEEKLGELRGAGLGEDAPVELEGLLQAATGEEAPVLEVTAWRQPEPDGEED